MPQPLARLALGLATCGWLDGRSPRPFVGDTRLGVEQAMAGSKERQRHWSTLANNHATKRALGCRPSRRSTKQCLPDLAAAD